MHTIQWKMAYLEWLSKSMGNVFSSSPDDNRETGYSNVLGEMVYLDNERSAEWLSKVKREILKSSMCDLSSGHFCDS